MAASLRISVACLIALTSASQYQVDYSWPKQVPSQATRFTAAAVVGHHVYIAQRGMNYSQPIMVFETDGTFVTSWGSQEIFGTQSGGFGVHGMNYNPYDNTIWITNVLDFSVSVFSLNGTRLATYGTPSKEGTSSDPLQFSHVADVDFSYGTSFISDGDGGMNDRVMSLTDGKLDWIQGSAGDAHLQFSSPHTITYVPTTDTIIVGDRGNNRTQHLTRNGDYIDGWDLGAKTIWGVRFDARHGVVVLADGNNQEVRIYDGTKIDSTPRLLEIIPIDKSQCDTPHEMALDYGTGDIYLTCVDNPNSGVLRINRLTQ
eukprot:TRINITY_DN10276_c1_g2_i1.p2 TRINITY_DN10276_c1_g2~~TRINITY_DN10276_c1_g2_i1.p2  ORF type:complete len:329 (+),score=40.79 TRINITY_DN10276_c1_g2_i1:45-989(+)